MVKNHENPCGKPTRSSRLGEPVSEGFKLQQQMCSLWGDHCHKYAWKRDDVLKTKINTYLLWFGGWFVIVLTTLMIKWLTKKSTFAPRRSSRSFLGMMILMNDHDESIWYYILVCNIIYIVVLDDILLILMV